MTNHVLLAPNLSRPHDGIENELSSTTLALHLSTPKRTFDRDFSHSDDPWEALLFLSLQGI